MSVECTVPKTYDNLADDWLTCAEWLFTAQQFYFILLLWPTCFPKKPINSAGKKKKKKRLP